MEVEGAMPGNRFEDVSLEGSKSFVTALLELKNLRPQLYSAADYCEKSYIKSEEKQMVLDNLKDYAVRTLVNAIDHLGTVAYKLSDILEHQTLGITSMQLKVTSLNQRLLLCQTYTEKEGLRQQQILTIIPRHHKHYILPTVNKKVHFNPLIQTDPKQNGLARARIYPSGAAAANTLSSHLSSETKPTVKGSPRGLISHGDSKASGKSFEVFSLLDAEVKSRKKSIPASVVAMQTLGVMRRQSPEVSKPLTPYRSFANTTPQREITRPPIRSKSMLSSFFVKQKTRQK